MSWETLLSGGGLTLFGFLLAMGWDLLKTERGNRQREKSLFQAALAEVTAVSATVTNNQIYVRKELDLLSQQTPQHLINPLDPVPGGFWDVVKLNPPRTFVRDPETLTKVRDVARRTDQINEIIRSRETFRVGNLLAISTVSNADGILRSYDEHLERFQDELLGALATLQDALVSAAPEY